MQSVKQIIGPAVVYLSNSLDLLQKQAHTLHTQFLTNKVYVQATEYFLLGYDLIENYDYESVQWKYVISVMMAVVFVWEWFLELRQRIRLSNNNLPQQLKGVISKETFVKSNQYNGAKVSFKMFSMIYSQVVLQLVFYFDLLPLIWNQCYQWLPKNFRGEIWHSLAFFYVAFTLNSIQKIPVDFISQFVIEAKFGFNKQTIGTFVGDIIKTNFLVAILGVPFFAGFLNIIHYAGENFVLYVYVFVLCFQIFFLLIFPTFIQPLFNKFTPLEEGSLRKKINQLAAKLKFPLTKIFVVDGSRRSSHSNAYFFGFMNNKRIVLFDTLIEKAGEEEIVAVLAHELGHWYHAHVFSNLVVAQIHFLVMFYTFSKTLGWQSVFTEFGFTGKPVFIYTPVDTIIGFFMNFLTRSKEFQADRFAKKHGYGNTLKSGLVKLLSDNLAVFNPDPLHSVWHLSHPPLIERLAAIDKAK